MQGFMNFVREQGVVGLAVGLVLGGAVGEVVKSLVDNLVNPLLGIMLGAAGDLSSWTIPVTDTVELGLGAFLNALISFAAIAAVVYYIVHGLGLDKLDKEK